MEAGLALKWDMKAANNYNRMFNEAYKIIESWETDHLPPTLTELIDILNDEISQPGTALFAGINTYENNKWGLDYFNCNKEYGVRYNFGYPFSNHTFKTAEEALLRLFMLIKCNKQWIKGEWQISKVDWTHAD